MLPKACHVPSAAALILALLSTDLHAAADEMALDPEAAERALERTLVSTGQLLLPKGQIEVAPYLGYTRVSRSDPVFHVVDSQATVGAYSVRRDVLDVGVELRTGILEQSQLEFNFPYRSVQESDVTTVGGVPASRTSASGSGFGDIRVGLARALRHEKSDGLNLIGRIEWDSATGKKSDGGVPLGGFGREEVIASLSATKRQDPLVFTGRLSYQLSKEKEGVKPGDVLGISFGSVLAASPDTSLRVQLDQSFVREVEVNHKSLAGSDQVIAMLGLGASSIIGRGRFLDLLVGAGLTDEAPDYTIMLSLSRRM